MTLLLYRLGRASVRWRRFVLLGWAVGAVGTVVAYWRLLQAEGASLHGVPFVLLALAALAVAALAAPDREPAST